MGLKQKFTLLKKALDNSATLKDFIMSIVPIEGTFKIDLTKLDPLLGQMFPKELRTGNFEFKICSLGKGEWLGFLLKEIE